MGLQGLGMEEAECPRGCSGHCRTWCSFITSQRQNHTDWLLGATKSEPKGSRLRVEIGSSTKAAPRALMAATQTALPPIPLPGRHRGYSCDLQCCGIRAVIKEERVPGVETLGQESGDLCLVLVLSLTSGQSSAYPLTS